MTAGTRTFQQQPESTMAQERGFSLMEVLVAVVIVSITIMALGPMVSGVTRGNRYGQSVSIASSRLQDKVEELKSLPYGDVSDGSETLDSPRMTRSWEVVSEPVKNSLKEVSVSVRWKSPTREAQHVSVKTFVANRNPWKPYKQPKPPPRRGALPPPAPAPQPAPKPPAPKPPAPKPPAPKPPAPKPPAPAPPAPKPPAPKPPPPKPPAPKPPAPKPPAPKPPPPPML